MVRFDSASTGRRRSSRRRDISCRFHIEPSTRLRLSAIRSSLRLEVNIAKARKMYPLNTTPVPMPGVEYVRARVAGKGVYEGGNKPYVDFNAVVAGTDPHASVRQRCPRRREHHPRPWHSAAAPVGQGTLPHGELGVLVHSPRPDSLHDRGTPTFVADQGDIVYVPKQRWHLASLAGDGMSARLAMNGYPDLAHSFEAPDPGDASR